jgi:hypothetical protein
MPVLPNVPVEIPPVEPVSGSSLRDDFLFP